MFNVNAEKLIEKTAAGDKAAFENLYKQYKGLAFSVALAILRHRQDAEDILADTFINVYRQAAGYRGGSVKSWIAMIARNLALNRLRARQREVNCDFSENEQLYGVYSIEERFTDNAVLNAALAILSQNEREVVLLHNAGLKHREIADISDEPLGTVTWRYKNALKKLKNYLTDKGGK